MQILTQILVYIQIVRFRIARCIFWTKMHPIRGLTLPMLYRLPMKTIVLKILFEKNSSLIKSLVHHRHFQKKGLVMESVDFTQLISYHALDL